MRFNIETTTTEGLLTNTANHSRDTLRSARDFYEELRLSNATKLRGATTWAMGIIEMSLTDKLTGEEYAYLLMVRRPSGDLHYVEGPDRNTTYVRFLSWSLPSTPNLPEHIDSSVRTSPHTKDTPPDVWDMVVSGDPHRIRRVDVLDNGSVTEWVYPNRAEALDRWEAFEDAGELSSARYNYFMAYKRPETGNWVTIRTA